VNACCIYAALVFSSGLAATMVVTNLLNAGDHILSMDDVYGGKSLFLCQFFLVSAEDCGCLCVSWLEYRYNTPVISCRSGISHL